MARALKLDKFSCELAHNLDLGIFIFSAKLLSDSTHRSHTTTNTYYSM